MKLRAPDLTTVYLNGKTVYGFNNRYYAYGNVSFRWYDSYGADDFIPGTGN